MTSTSNEQDDASINTTPTSDEAFSDNASITASTKPTPLDLAHLAELLETSYTIEAKTLLRSFLTSPNRTSDSLFRAAELFMKHHIEDMAELTYRAILEIDSDNISVLGRLGDIAQKRGDSYSAVNFYRRIIKNDPTPENWVYIGLGNALEAIGEIQEAIGFFKKAVSTSEYKRELSLRIENLIKKQQRQSSSSADQTESIESMNKIMDTGTPITHRRIDELALGFLEAAATSTITGEGVVVGWTKYAPGAAIWLENNEGEKISLNTAFRFDRPDVDDVYGNSFGHISGDAGFIIRFASMKIGEYIRLMASYDGTSITLSETQCKSMGGRAIAAAQWLFGLATPVSQLQKRFSNIDIPIIDALLDYERKTQSALPIQIHQLGSPATKPTVSIIIPLYGRIDFVESQFIEFSRDAWLMANAEIIYVVDDPKLTENFFALAENLHRIYRLPFKWAWGSANRGFSGANNLGSHYAKGKYLLFLNSDVFPQNPGWLEQLLDVLDTNPKIGAVGPRLIFANGSIQHAGMSFVRKEELGIWVNHHPSMGLDPSLDPTENLSLMPAITGACLAMRRSEFDQIEGWDTGYLIGDFEDSDLCLKLRSAGFDIAYLPTVQLTHLERQSFKLLGQDDFRFRVVIYNAVRHQSRWQHLIEKLAHINDVN